MAARDVFVSYSRGDAYATKAIASELQQLGQTVWLDAQLSGGQQWWNTILEQIRRCDAARRGSTAVRVKIPHLLAGVTEVAGAFFGGGSGGVVPVRGSTSWSRSTASPSGWRRSSDTS